MLFNRFFYSHTGSFKSHTTVELRLSKLVGEQFLVKRGFYEPIHKLVDVTEIQGVLISDDFSFSW